MFSFGRIRIPATQVFHATNFSYVFVNISPVVPGHVLVSPREVRPTMHDMSEAETSDLLVTGRFVARITERVFGATASTYVIQDGKDAGQTIPHVHLHIMPRRPGDFQRNDDIYTKVEEEKRVLRSAEDMAAEAQRLREGVEEQRVLDAAESLLAEHFASRGVDESHGIVHARTVLGHCCRALAVEKQPISTKQRLAIMLAALLHDADDRKYFGDAASLSLEHGRRIAAAATSHLKESGEIVEAAAECIGLVSASKNKNTTVAAGEEWKLLPRFSDRLEAIGWPGVVRCYDYNRRLGAALFTAATARVATEEQLAAVAPPSRFAAYNGDSASFMDHFYDKLIHVCEIDSANAYFVAQTLARRKELLDFVFEFGKTGKIDETKFNGVH